jgi:uncharacterized glyoxalase superfamily protein PhnB
MSLLSVTPNLMVYNVEETVEYYQNNFGFVLLETVPEKPSYDWAMMKKDNVVLMFQSKKSLESEIEVLKTQKPGGGVTLYIKTDNVEQLYEEVNEKVEIVSDLEHTFYGTKEFSIIDLNGYVLTFAQHVEG